MRTKQVNLHVLELRDVHGYHFSNQEESMEVWKVIVMLSAQTITNVISERLAAELYYFCH